MPGREDRTRDTVAVRREKQRVLCRGRSNGSSTRAVDKKAELSLTEGRAQERSPLLAGDGTVSNMKDRRLYF